MIAAMMMLVMMLIESLDRYVCKGLSIMFVWYSNTPSGHPSQSHRHVAPQPMVNACVDCSTRWWLGIPPTAPPSTATLTNVL